MISPVVEKRIEKLEAMADELDLVLKEHGWTDYAAKLLSQMRVVAAVLDDEHEDAEKVLFSILEEYREDATLGDILMAQQKEKAKASIPADLSEEEKAQGFYFRTVNGNIIQFSAETGMPMNGQLQAFGDSGVAAMVNRGVDEHVHRHEKVRKSTAGKSATNFELEDTTCEIAVPLMIKDGKNKSGKLIYEMQPGKLSKIQTIGAADMNRKVDQAANMVSQYGGEENDWVKMKGIGMVKDEKGRIREANIHFFHNPNVGQGDWKVVKFVDEMTDKEKWWL